MFWTHQAQAASMYFSPSSGSYAAGQSFSVGVYVTSTDQATNAYSGTFSFPEDLVEVTRLTKSGITSLWVQDPTYSNDNGSVSFKGIVLSPGFTGSGGKIITVTFRAKAAGSVPLRFTESSALANDGQGTNILTGTGSADFKITAAQAAPPATPGPTPAGEVPAAPVILSRTHPDPARWYQGVDPEFSWSVPPGVTGVAVLIDHSATQDPPALTPGLPEKMGYTGVEEGLWYFHARFKNATGWGPTTHFTFRIDHTPPEAPVVARLGSEEVTELRPSVTIRADDALSGVAYYELSIDGQTPIRILASEVADATPYHLPTQQPGAHTLSVVAYDLAGNVSEGTGLSLSIPLLCDIYGFWSILPLALLFAMFLVILLLMYLLWRRHREEIHGSDQLLKNTLRVRAELRRTLAAMRTDVQKQLDLIKKAQRDLADEDEDIRIMKKLPRARVE